MSRDINIDVTARDEASTALAAAAEALKSLSTQTTSTAGSVKTLSEETREMVSGGGASVEALQTIAESSKKTADEVDSLRDGMSQLSEILQGVVAGGGALLQLVGWGRAFRTARTGAENAAGAVRSLRRTLREFADSGGANLGRFGSAAVSLAKGVTVAKVAVTGLTVAVGVGLARAAAKATRALADLSAEVQLDARYLEVSTGALFGQAQAYERVTGEAGDFARMLAELEKVQAGAAAGNATHIRFVEQLGVSLSTLQQLDTIQFWELVKKGVDEGTLSYKEAARVLDRDLIEATDEVQTRLDRFSDAEAERVGYLKGLWRGLTDDVTGGWDSITHGIGDAYTQLDLFASKVDEDSGQILGWLNPVNAAITLTGELLGEAADEATRFSEAFRGGTGPGTWTVPPSLTTDGSDPQNLYKMLTPARWEQLYAQPDRSNLLHRSDESQAAVLAGQNAIWQIIEDAINQGKRETGGGGGGSTGGGALRDVRVVEADRLKKLNEMQLLSDEKYIERLELLYSTFTDKLSDQAFGVYRQIETAQTQVRLAEERATREREQEIRGELTEFRDAYQNKKITFAEYMTALETRWSEATEAMSEEITAMIANAKAAQRAEVETAATQRFRDLRDRYEAGKLTYEGFRYQAFRYAAEAHSGLTDEIHETVETAKDDLMRRRYKFGVLDSDVGANADAYLTYLRGELREEGGRFTTKGERVMDEILRVQQQKERDLYVVLTSDDKPDRRIKAEFPPQISEVLSLIHI